MSDPKAHYFVESARAKVPVWMTRANGWNLLVSMIVWADIGLQILFEALYARFPGVGTNTALPYLSRSRGLVRGMSDTDATFAARLLLWLDRWRLAGTQLGLARAIQDYCTGSPRVRVVNRAGLMTTLAAGGASSTVTSTSWNWDGLSNPGRAGYWSELWVIVYTPPWPVSGFMDTSNPAKAGLGIGSAAPRVDVDAIKNLLDTWKSAHSFIRALVWSYDASLFDPNTPATMPDGKWGMAGYMGGTGLVMSTRAVKEQANAVRVWEPSTPPQIEFTGFGPV